MVLGVSSRVVGGAGKFYTTASRLRNSHASQVPSGCWDFSRNIMRAQLLRVWGCVLVSSFARCVRDCSLVCVTFLLILPQAIHCQHKQMQMARSESPSFRHWWKKLKRLQGARSIGIPQQSLIATANDLGSYAGGMMHVLTSTEAECAPQAPSSNVKLCFALHLRTLRVQVPNCKVFTPNHNYDS